MSDWSSDVCPSDLKEPAIDTPMDASAAMVAAPAARLSGKGRDDMADTTASTALVAVRAPLFASAEAVSLSSCAMARQDSAISTARNAERKSVVSGTSESVRVDLGGRRVGQKKN